MQLRVSEFPMENDCSRRINSICIPKFRTRQFLVFYSTKIIIRLMKLVETRILKDARRYVLYRMVKFSFR